jgi:DNA-binding response OmpR family regulator
VLPAGDADAAWALLAAGDVDLVVLDINLPGTMNGLQVLHRLRAEGRSVPVIMLTGWSSEMNRVIGFQLGADDYVVKPFSPRELAARVTAVLRRATAPDAAPRSRLTRGSITVDAGRREASAAGRRLRLSRREFDLLAHLTLRSPQVATYDELLRAVWHGSTGTTATVNEHVRRLRRALHDAAPHGPTITNVRGVGYVLDA